jgi:hypothetical protein
MFMASLPLNWLLLAFRIQDVDGRGRPGHDKDQFQPFFLRGIVT